MRTFFIRFVHPFSNARFTSRRGFPFPFAFPFASHPSVRARPLKTTTTHDAGDATTRGDDDDDEERENG